MDTGVVTTAEEGTTLTCPALEQRFLRLAAGGRRSERLDGRSGLLFVAHGEGVLRVDGEEHRLPRESAAFVGDGEAPVLENDGAEPLELVLVLTPPGEPDGPRVVRYDEQEAEEAGIGREFRLLAGSSQATQFIGLVPPGRAKMHNHPYEELSYLVEGEGVVHWADGTSVPVAPGSCIYFPRLVFHSLENVGSTPIRIMGVFHPAGSPADRVDELDY